MSQEAYRMPTPTARVRQAAHRASLHFAGWRRELTPIELKCQSPLHHAPLRTQHSDAALSAAFADYYFDDIADAASLIFRRNSYRAYARYRYAVFSARYE